MSLELQIQIAKAKVAARKKREQLQAEEAKKTKELEKAMLIEEVLKSIEAPKNGENGRDGRDAPEMSEILEQIKPMLPAPVIHKTEERVSREELEAIMSTLFEEKLPEIAEELRPATEQIIEKIDPSELDDYITRKDLDDALRRVQKAIEQSQGGGGGGIKELVNVIQVEETSTVTSAQINPNRINVVLVNQPNITVTLPTPSAEVFIIVQQGYNGDETFTVCYE